MRAAHYNGYGSPLRMCIHFNVPFDRRSTIALSRSSCPLIETILDFNPTEESQLAQCFYDRSSVKGLPLTHGDFELRQKNFDGSFKYCPTCLNEELLTVFLDIQNLDFCPLHNTTLIKRCPKCNNSTSWDKANIFHCQCGYDRRSTTAEAHYENVPQHPVTFGVNSDLPRLSKMLTAYNLLDRAWHSFRPNEMYIPPTFYSNLLSRLKDLYLEQINTYPRLPFILQSAPWLANGLNEIPTKHSETPSAARQCEKDNCCTAIKLTRNELNTTHRSSEKHETAFPHSVRVEPYQSKSSHHITEYECTIPWCSDFTPSPKRPREHNKRKHRKKGVNELRPPIEDI